jgi:hypothetical protein
MMLGMAISGAGFSVTTPSLGATDLMVKNLAVQVAGTLSSHDINAFAALFTDDFVNHQRTAAVPPSPAGTRPKDGAVACFASRLKGLSDLAVSVEKLRGEGRFCSEPLPPIAERLERNPVRLAILSLIQQASTSRPRDRRFKRTYTELV